MNRPILSLITPLLLAAVCNAQGGLWSQSTDNTTIEAGSASCVIAGGMTDTSYWRHYDPLACGLAGDFEVQWVTFAVESATTGSSGSQLLTVNLRDGAGFPVGAAAAPILGSGTVLVVDTELADQTFESVSFQPPVFVTAGTTVAVEVLAPSGLAQNASFLIGSNGRGETPLDSTYTSAADCGIHDPVPFSAVGLPGVHGIIDMACAPVAGSRIGSVYCSPNTSNSTGSWGMMSATGSAHAAQMDVRLEARSLPPGQFGYFIASRTQGFIPTPSNSSGNLCVVGQLGRYSQPGQIFQVDATGRGSLQVGNLPVPTNVVPGGEVIAPGDSWNWQAWYRDAGNINNFSEAYNIVFH